MAVIFVIILIVLAIVLFIAAWFGWINEPTLQKLANIAAILALVAAVAVFFIPPSRSPEPTQQHVSSNVPVFDDFEGVAFNEAKWFIDFDDSNLSYDMWQKDGQLCFDVENLAEDTKEFYLRGQSDDNKFKVIEADITLVSGNGTVGLDTWNSEEWDHLILDSSGVLRVAHGFPGDGEGGILQGINCCPSIHQLKKIQGEHQVEYFVDGVRIKERTGNGLPIGFSIVAVPTINDKIQFCVDELRVEFD